MWKQLPRIVDVVIAQVESYIGSPLNPTTREVEIEGTRASRLIVGPAPIDVTDVAIDGVVIEPSEYDVRRRGEMIRRSSSWGDARSTVTVTYSAGWDVLPNALTSVIVSASACTLSNTAGYLREQVEGASYLHSIGFTTPELLILNTYPASSSGPVNANGSKATLIVRELSGMSRDVECRVVYQDEERGSVACRVGVPSVEEQLLANETHATMVGVIIRVPAELGAVSKNQIILTAAHPALAGRYEIVTATPIRRDESRLLCRCAVV